MLTNANDNESNELNQEIIKRLAFIRFMYTQGVYYSNRPEPISSISILLFHDSIELFLQLVCDTKNINIDSPPIMVYYDEIEKKGGIILEEKENMRKFNNVRNSFKHKGLIISKSEIDVARINVLNFFRLNTLLVFNREFDSLSLMDFVTYQPTRDRLKNAEKLMNEKNYKRAIGDISMAFDLIIKDYIMEKVGMNFFVESRYSDLFSRPVNVSRNLFNNNIPREIFHYIEQLSKHSEQLEKQIDSIRTTLKINTLNIDYKKYIKFRRIAEEPFRVGGGNHAIYTDTERIYTMEECQFCMDFVIESAMKIQELDL